MEPEKEALKRLAELEDNPDPEMVRTLARMALDEAMYSYTTIVHTLFCRRHNPNVKDSPCNWYKEEQVACTWFETDHRKWWKATEDLIKKAGLENEKEIEEAFKVLSDVGRIVDGAIHIGAHKFIFEYMKELEVRDVKEDDTKPGPRDPGYVHKGWEYGGTGGKPD